MVFKALTSHQGNSGDNAESSAHDGLVKFLREESTRVVNVLFCINK